jgi:phage recombination protein Bet
MNQNLPATKSKGQLVARFANKFGIDQAQLFTILKATAFSQPVDKRTGQATPITNEVMASLLIVADQYNLNPFTREIYAFPDKKGGIVPVVGVDGWNRLANEHPQFDGIEFVYSDNTHIPDGGKECPEWIEVRVFRKDRSRPMVIREYLDEVYREPFIGTGRDGNPYTVNGPWQSHTKRMLRHKGMIQAIRTAFGYAGIYDQDEAAQGIIDVDFRLLPPASEPKPGEDPINAFNQLWRACEKPDEDALRDFVNLTADAHKTTISEVISSAMAHVSDFRHHFLEWLEKNKKKIMPNDEPGDDFKPCTPEQKQKILDLCASLNISWQEMLREVTETGKAYWKDLYSANAEWLIKDLQPTLERESEKHPTTPAPMEPDPDDPGCGLFNQPKSWQPSDEFKRYAKDNQLDPDKFEKFIRAWAASNGVEFHDDIEPHIRKAMERKETFLAFYQMVGGEL